jgi:hypothetical protein
MAPQEQPWIHLSEEVTRLLQNRLLDLAEEVTNQALPDNEHRHQHLVLVAVLEQIGPQLKALQGAVARLAATGGADYADLGRAAGITKQAAAYRWPDLAEVTRKARAANAGPVADTDR